MERIRDYYLSDEGILEETYQLGIIFDEEGNEIDEKELEGYTKSE